MKKCLTILIILLLLMSALPIAVFAVNSNQTTVRVGYFAFDGYHMIDASGNRSGYGYELLQRIAGYAGFTYEYVDTYQDGNNTLTLTWEKAQELLAAGEIDILTSAQKTTGREVLFDFSEASVGTSAAILTVKSNNTKFIRGDYENWGTRENRNDDDLMLVGIIDGNSRNEGLKAFAAEKGFDYNVAVDEDDNSLYSTTSELVAALHAGEIDAILTSNLRTTHDETIIAQFDSSPFYAIVDKGDSQLLSQVNAAISQMDIYEPNFRVELMNKYYPSYTNTEVVLDKEELDFLAANADATYTAIINPDYAPYSYLKTANGSSGLAGCLYDIALEIIDRAGINVTFIECDTNAEYRELVDSGAADIRFDANYNYNLAEDTGYWLTTSYMDVPVSRLYLKDSDPSTFTTAAVLRNSDIAENYAAALSERGITINAEYDSIAAVVAAVLSGEQDMALMPVNTAEISVRDDERNRLVSDVAYGYEMSFAVGVNTEQNRLLYTILKKSVSSLTTDEIDEYIQAHVNDLARSYSFIGYLYDYPLRVVGAFVAVVAAAVVAVVIVYTVRRRKALIKQMQEDQQRNIILNDALVATRKANEAKSNFMSRISHEIRTPLNAIIGYNSIARSEITEAKTDAERRQAEMKAMDCLGKSEIASKHLLTVINDVLDMSAIDSGKISIAHEKFDFTSLISSLTTVFYAQAVSKGIKFVVSIDTLTEEWFVGDQMRVNQILTNLLSNAIKFTSDGGSVKLIVRQPEAQTNAAHMYFEVSDTGIGMTQDFLKRVWDPFEQADASISRRFGGSGLGLSIVKNLVDLLGGTIEVNSQPNVGTTFKIELTFERTEQPESNTNYDFSHVNALIVDDDRSTCDYINLLFTRFGARSTAVTSGKDAVKAFEASVKNNTPYTVCLIDWQMPKMDGIETVKQIRKIVDKDIPIIVVTAYDFSEIMDKAMAIGVTSFVSKPLFQSSLFNMLANIYGEAKNSPKKEHKYDFKGIRVLLAEDNSMNMEIQRHILSSAGLVVDSAWNGQEAVDMFMESKSGYYKAVLMDVQMPVMDGHQATRAIRSSFHPDAKTVPVIAMTADAFAENVAQCLESGMNDHISKPLEITVLFETLKKYI